MKFKKLLLIIVLFVVIPTLYADIRFATYYTKSDQYQQSYDTLGTISIQTRAHRDDLADKLAEAYNIIPDGEKGIVLSLFPFNGDNRWKPDTGLRENIFKVIGHGSELIELANLIEPYRDKIYLVLCEDEQGWVERSIISASAATKWENSQALSDMNMDIYNIVKGVLDLPVAFYGRAMMCVYGDNKQAFLTPWWNGEMSTDFITPFMYDPLMPEIEAVTMDASFELAESMAMKVIPHVGINMRSYGGDSAVITVPEIEVARGGLLRAYEDQIEAIALWVKGGIDFDDAEVMEHISYLKFGLGEE